LRRALVRCAGGGESERGQKAEKRGYLEKKGREEKERERWNGRGKEDTKGTYLDWPMCIVP